MVGEQESQRQQREARVTSPCFGYTKTVPLRVLVGVRAVRAIATLVIPRVTGRATVTTPRVFYSSSAGWETTTRRKLLTSERCQLWATVRTATPQRGRYDTVRNKETVGTRRCLRNTVGCRRFPNGCRPKPKEPVGVGKRTVSQLRRTGAERVVGDIGLQGGGCPPTYVS